jgi:hypothetical protein
VEQRRRKPYRRDNEKIASDKTITTPPTICLLTA